MLFIHFIASCDVVAPNISMKITPDPGTNENCLSLEKAESSEPTRNYCVDMKTT